MKKVLGIFLLSLMSGFSAVLIYKAISPDPMQQVLVENTASPVRYTGFSGGIASGLDFTEAAESTINAVVHVKTQTEVNMQLDPWAQFFNQKTQPQIQMGSGSGVIITADGYIVTNNHVIDGATNITVSLNDGSDFSATLVGSDPSTDLALLKIESQSDLPTIPFGNSDDVRVGEWVLAVGNPFDLTSTVTAGIVSAKARNINLLEFDPNNDIFPVESFIQTDAAVNPGNSGGALVNTRGELIGINSAIASKTGSFSGYSFAIPSGIVEKVTRDFIEFGDVQRAYIGVVIRNVDQSIAAELGLKKVAGILVNDLSENGAAAEAGIVKGDVILAVNSVIVNSVPELQEQVSKFRPGDEVIVKVWRTGKEKELSLVLRDSQGRTSLDSRIGKNTVSPLSSLGAVLDVVPIAELQKLGLNGGVKVKEIKGGKMKAAGLEPGFIITGVDRDRVNSMEDLERILAMKNGGVLLEGYYPNGTKAYYGLGM